MASVILNMPKILNILGVFALVPFEYDIYIIKVIIQGVKKTGFIAFSYSVGKWNLEGTMNLDFI